MMIMGGLFKLPRGPGIVIRGSQSMGYIEVEYEDGSVSPPVNPEAFDLIEKEPPYYVVGNKYTLNGLEAECIFADDISVILRNVVGYCWTIRPEIHNWIPKEVKTEYRFTIHKSIDGHPYFMRAGVDHRKPIGEVDIIMEGDDVVDVVFRKGRANGEVDRYSCINYK